MRTSAQFEAIKGLLKPVRLKYNARSDFSEDTRVSGSAVRTTLQTVDELEKERHRDLEDARVLRKISARQLEAREDVQIFQDLIDAAVTIMHADFASMQLFYPERGKYGELKLLGFHGFEPEAAKLWEWVRADTECACGQALASRTRCIIPDIEQCDALKGSEHLAQYRASGIKAVQSTPLISRKGEIVGMISTHWKTVHQPSERDLVLLDILARQATDILSTQRYENVVHEMQGYLAAIIASSDDAIISKDLNGVVTSWNKGAERIFGYTAEEIIGKPITLLIPPEQLSEEEHILNTLKTGERVDHFETTRRHKDGHLLNVSITVSPIRDTSGKVIGASKISRDITERTKLELRAREAQERAEAANMAKTEFLANMSHEIRTPMNAVIGLSGILAKSKPLSEKQQEYIKTLQMSADSLLSLINDLLDIAKIEAHSVELEHIPFSVVQLAQETISMMSVRTREKGLSFAIVQECQCIETRQFLGDPTRLRQILVNLCSNALKFTERGNITLTISCEENAAGDGKELVRIAVQDTGIGIAAEKMGDIFQKFTQADSSISRKYGGTGLGLAITKTLAEIMGGTIELTSELGKGSTFTVAIPFEVAAATTVQNFAPKTPAASEQARQTMQQGQPRVLLVEDYEPNVLVAETFLESFGYSVDVASNGLQAIEKIRANDYIATLMDVQMHGMNGLEATQLIRAHEKQAQKPRIYIIGMTAHALVGDRERCIAAGMDDYIAKPFNPDRLEEMLAQVSRQRAAA